MSQIKDPGSAAQKIADFIQILVSKGRLEIKSQIIACNGQVQPDSSSSAGAPHAASTKAAPATPEIRVDLTGPDVSLLLSHNGELLHAIEHIAAKILRLEPEEHDSICFDAAGFKADRDRDLQLSAEAAIQRVRSTHQSHAFPPMTSRERRMLHLILAQSGLPTASSGEGPRRFVVLYPEGHQPAASEQPESRPSSPDRTQAIRNRFRPR
jgi:spoIIIJ-associated protein